MKLTNRRVIEFFGTDNFVNFVAKKHGWFIKGEDDMFDVRYYSLSAVSRYLVSEKEFENDRHLYSTVEMCVQNAIKTVLNSKKSLKNNLPIQTESTLTIVKSGDETFSIYEANAIHHDVEYDNSREYLQKVADAILMGDDKEIFSLRMENKSYQEIADIMFFSKEAARYRISKIEQKLKDFFNAKEGKVLLDVPRVRKDNGSKSPKEDKASPERCSEASSFLGI